VRGADQRGVRRGESVEQSVVRAVRKAKAEGKMEGRAEAALRIEQELLSGGDLKALIDELCGWTRMEATDVA